jgi:triosephosphate isomerase (TIM)
VRQPLIIGNWKMHGSPESVVGLTDALLAGVAELVRDGGGVEVAVLPPAVFIPLVAARCAGQTLYTGAQNVAPAAEGAYTGEVSAAMLAAFGCRYALAGHSERRQLFAESEALVAARVLAALRGGVSPVLCVGETGAERAAGAAEVVIGAQLDAVLDVLATAAISPVGRWVIAYEPVWAIGSGLAATPEQAQAMHAFIRGRLARRAPVLGETTRLLYGGSVKPATAPDLLAMADIDGLLVGGASLVATDFLAICRLAQGPAALQAP